MLRHLARRGVDVLLESLPLGGAKSIQHKLILATCAKILLSILYPQPKGLFHVRYCLHKLSQVLLALKRHSHKQIA